MFWMVMLSVLLFWLPLIGPFIAGFVGGRKAGGVIQAAIAVFLPGLLFGMLMAVFGGLIANLPFLGAFAGLGGLIMSTLHIGPMLVGALVGGWIGEEA